MNELNQLVEVCEALEGCMTPEIYQLLEMIYQLQALLQTLI